MRKQFGFMCLGIFLGVTIAHAQKVQHLKTVVSSKKGTILGLPIQVVEVPTGTFDMDAADGDSTKKSSDQHHPVLISDFYISTTEVTNAQYREFTEWVKDSIAAYLLGGKYLTIDKKTGDTTINWKYASSIKFSDPANAEKLASIMLDPSRTLSHKAEVDPDKLIYVMRGFNYQEAAKLENKGKNPSEFVYRYEVPIYPDTLVWMRDFGYSNNEEMALSYFSSPKYKNFPIVGVNWKQANAYCDWFTKQRIYAEQKRRRMAIGGQCRLPTEAEWAYAADLNDNGTKEERRKLMLAEATRNASRRKKPVKEKNNNSKRKQSDIIKDSINALFDDENGGNTLFPQNVMTESHGEYGIYGMSENVSEWTNTSYYEAADNFENRFNPDIQWGTIDSDSKSKRRKVICGGSWKDTPIFKTTSNRFYNDMNEAHSYIGFRVLINLPQ